MFSIKEKRFFGLIVFPAFFNSRSTLFFRCKRFSFVSEKVLMSSI